MDYRIAAQSDEGRVRAHNEDAYLTELPLIAVADGMGGHKAGEIASGLALEILTGWKDRLASADTPEQRSRLLKAAVLDANEKLFAKGREDPELEGMGTTLTVGWVESDSVTLAHVGDSRAYLLRGERLSMLTEDQTIVHQWEKEGKIQPGEAAHHPHRHILLQAVGSGSDLDVDITHVELRDGDRLLLSSDGLHGMITDDTLRELLLEHTDPDATCRVLIEKANEAGGNDNITVLILDAGLPQTAATGRTEGSGDTAPVIVSKLSDRGRKGAGGRTRLGRGLMVGLVFVALAASVAALVVWRSGRVQYVVATSGETIAVLRGSPGRDGTEARGEIVRVYRDEPLEAFPRPVQRELRSGIPVGSLEEAERVIERLHRVLGPAATPTPEPPEGDPPDTEPDPELVNEGEDP